MDNIAKLKRMDEHLAKHPADYQTVIARLKTISDIYEHRGDKVKIERLKRLAEIKRKMREEDKQYGK